MVFYCIDVSFLTCRLRPNWSVHERLRECPWKAAFDARDFCVPCDQATSPHPQTLECLLIQPSESICGGTWLGASAAGVPGRFEYRKRCIFEKFISLQNAYDSSNSSCVSPEINDEIGAKLPAEDTYVPQQRHCDELSSVCTSHTVQRLVAAGLQAYM